MPVTFYDAPHLVSTYAMGRKVSLEEAADPSLHPVTAATLTKAVVRPVGGHVLDPHAGSSGHAAADDLANSKRGRDQGADPSDKRSKQNEKQQADEALKSQFSMSR